MENINATIVIPTYNRSKELGRLLTFLDVLNNKFHVIVLDGSTASKKNINASIISEYSNVSHHKFDENLHLGLRLSKGLNEFVDTKYVIFCPDDDFVIPDAIAHSIEFLENNENYSAVNGRTLCIGYPKYKSKTGLFFFMDELRHPLNLDSNSFINRCIKLEQACHNGCPPLFYALRRTSQAREIFNTLHAELKYSSMELLSNMLTLLWGKSTTLNHLLMIRDYSSETTCDSLRQDPVYYISEQDNIYIRKIIKLEMKKINPELSDFILDRELEHAITLPVSQITNSLNYNTKTKLYNYWFNKKNWISYLVNFLAPGLPQKFDTLIQKNIVVALKKSFVNNLSTNSK